MAVQKSGAGDKFANFFAAGITQAVINTTYYELINFPYSVMDKVGLILHRIEYSASSLATALVAATDNVFAGLCVSNNLADPGAADDPAIIDCHRRILFGPTDVTAGTIVQEPHVKDFTNLPGGGILVAPSPLYFYIGSVGCPGVVGFEIRCFYTWIQLKPEEYWELVESRRIITS